MAVREDHNKRILMISRNLKCGDIYESLDSILRLAVAERADIVLFALFTLDYKYMQKPEFRKRLSEFTLKHNCLVVLEFTDLKKLNDNTVVTFNKGIMKVFFQWFSKSTDDSFWKEALLGELPHRIFNKNELLLICGELNLGLKVNRKMRRVEDPYKVLSWLDKNDIRLIMDPFHDTAVRYEVAYKKRELSKNKRIVVSVWNKNPKKHHNSLRPFHLFYDGQDVSNKIVELNNTHLRKDLRFGIIDTTEVSRL